MITLGVVTTFALVLFQAVEPREPARIELQNHSLSLAVGAATLLRDPQVSSGSNTLTVELHRLDTRSDGFPVAELVQRAADGTVKSVNSMVFFGPSSRSRITRAFDVELARWQEGDRLILNTVLEPIPERGPARASARQLSCPGCPTCQGFCDQCATRAESLCTHGVLSYSCECTSDTRKCSFTCNPPPI